jgi:DNA-binding CsgD family transcriptional regulator
MERVFEADLRALVRMLAEVAAMEGCRLFKQNRILTGLSDLVGANFWLWGRQSDSRGDGGWIECAWGDVSGRIEAAGHGDRRAMDLLFAGDSSERAVVGGLAVGPVLSRFGPPGENGRCGIALGRMAGGAEFSERERDLVEIVLEEIPWLLDPDGEVQPAIAGVRLSGQMEQALEFLLLGLPRKEIAGRMGVSINTVAGYVRDIYHRLGVRSHPELMTRYSGGGS